MVIRIVMTSSVSSSAKNILYKNAPADSLEIGLHKLKIVKHSQHPMYINKILHGKLYSFNQLQLLLATNRNVSALHKSK